jgi:beta-lactamase superfamily II metal-dependent hydrolase
MSRLVPAASTFTVRMYRQGHGDCFLLATLKEDSSPFYMLIDCGLWTGSEVSPRNSIVSIIEDIHEATAGALDVLLITHEHLDHVSGFKTAGENGVAGSIWDTFSIGEVWLGWTEDDADRDANSLRERFNDIVLGLASFSAKAPKLGLDADDDRVALVRELLQLHTGESRLSTLKAARGNALDAEKVPGISNKLAMQGIRKRGKVKFLSPEAPPIPLTGAMPGIKAFTLGPPRDPKLLLSLDPRSNEEFKLDDNSAFVLRSQGEGSGETINSPFSPRFGRRPEKLLKREKDFFNLRYGKPRDDDHPEAWRRIDTEWADVVENLALRLNDEVNNTSLVIAIELPHTKKVLLFTGDAQRGSWVSWANLKWSVDGKTVTSKDLLSRVVFYKVGHHGSHNATLNGRNVDAHPNLDWMARGEFADDFVAMIPANKPWAEAKRPYPWRHPLKAIEESLLTKTQGRLFRTDLAGLPSRPEGVAVSVWRDFLRRSKANSLYFEYTIEDF